MSYTPTRRQWIKLWVEEWLGGTTRFELDPAERSIWADLLAMAGRSKFPGIIASGEYNDGFRGYPLQYLAGILVCPESIVLSTLKKCEDKGKIKVERKTHDNIEGFVITIVNWQKYQSEYQRQAKYRERGLQPELQPKNKKVTGRGRGRKEEEKKEREKEREKEKKQPSPSPTTNLKTEILQLLTTCLKKEWGTVSSEDPTIVTPREPSARELAQLRDLAEEISVIGRCPSGEIEQAFKETAAQAKLHISYVRAVILDWLGIKR